MLRQLILGEAGEGDGVGWEAAGRHCAVWDR